MENKKQLTINIICTILYAVFTLTLVMHHEIWADEAQVWLLSKNLSLFELFQHLVEEGHPSLFYLLMMPFAKTECPILIMQLFCWLCSSAAVFILLQFSSFSKMEKTSIILSAGFLYFFPVIARSYSILPFLTFLAAILYRKQKEYPILYAIVLVLIANTHVIMFLFSTILGFYFLYDNVLKEKKVNRKITLSTTIIFLGLLLVIFQLALTPFGASCAIKYSSESVLKNISITFFQFFQNAYGFTYKPILLIIGTLFSIIFLYILKKNKRLFFLATLSIGFQFFIYITSYGLFIYPSKSFSAFLILIFCLWQVEKNTFIRIIVSISFLLSFFNGAKFAINDYFNNYSSGKETAEYIKKNLPKDSVFIPLPEPYALSIMLYLPDYKFWSGTNSTYIKYMKWSCKKNNSDDIVFDYKKVKSQNIYFIISTPNPAIDDLLNSGIDILFTSHPSIAKGEAFKIIKYVQSNN